MTEDKPKTAAELMKELEADEEYQKRRLKRQELRAQRRRFLDKAEAPLVQELRSAGVGVDSVWDLVNTSQPYPEAIPILLEHLDAEYPSEITNGIARALAVPVLNPEDWDVLLSKFFDESDEEARYGLALALRANAEEEHASLLQELVQNSEYGKARIEFAEALFRVGNKNRVEEILAPLVSDPEIGESIERLLERGSSLAD